VLSRCAINVLGPDFRASAVVSPFPSHCNCFSENNEEIASYTTGSEYQAVYCAFDKDIRQFDFTILGKTPQDLDQELFCQRIFFERQVEVYAVSIVA